MFNIRPDNDLRNFSVFPCIVLGKYISITTSISISLIVSHNESGYMLISYDLTQLYCLISSLFPMLIVSR